MRNENSLTLVSHELCPYVQRAVIALQEKGIPYERKDIDLAAKPNWFLELSPTGKTPLLVTENTPVFESNVILEFLEETQPHSLHPENPLVRARHRGWLEFASQVLNDIAGLYNADNDAAYEQKVSALRARFRRVESVLDDGPYFAGRDFSLVDAAFGPVFRYFDVFEGLIATDVFDGLPKTKAWRSALSQRDSVKAAVAKDYPEKLMAFLRRRDSVLGRLASERLH